MNRSVLVLLCVGLCQMAADVAGLPVLKALAAASGASPAPRVFSRYGGLEPFSMTFALAYIDRAGRPQLISITPERYSALRGPYNRRNSYGAAIAAGPALHADDKTRAMIDSVLQHGLCGEAPVLRELGMNPDDIASPITIRYPARADANTAGLPLSLVITCQ